METLTTTIYYTSDTHGYLFQTDYVSQDDKEMGLLNCISNFKNKDRNTLILDGGDVLQGSPLARYYTDMGKSNLKNPMARAFNAGDTIIGHLGITILTSAMIHYSDILGK
jgi:2',3'-cyclic-nucleotide 2'-phosphodiesterase/3'-nucleotidase